MTTNTKDSPAGSECPAFDRVDVDFSQSARKSNKIIATIPADRFYNSPTLSNVVIYHGADGERNIYSHRLLLALRSK